MTPEEWRQHLRGYGWTAALYEGEDIMVFYPWEQKQALAKWHADGRQGQAPPMQYQMGGNSSTLALLPDGLVLKTGMECTFTNICKHRVRGVITTVVLPWGAEGGLVCRFRYKLKNGYEVEDSVSSAINIQPTREKRWRP
jgi:hypothetical protein